MCFSHYCEKEQLPKVLFNVQYKSTMFQTNIRGGYQTVFFLQIKYILKLTSSVMLSIVLRIEIT